MKKLLEDKFYLFYIIAFIVLSLMNFFLTVSPLVVKNLLIYETTGAMFINSLIGNFTFILLILGICMFCKKKKTSYIILIVSTFIISVLTFLLGIFSNYYGMMFGFDTLENFSSEASGGAALGFLFDSAIALLKTSSPVFFVSLFILLFAYIIYNYYNKKHNNIINNNSNRNIKLGLSMIVLGLLCFVTCNFGYNKINDDTYYEYSSSSLYKIQSKGLLSHYLVDAVQYFTDSKPKIDEEDKIKTLEDIKKYTNVSINNDYTNIFKDKNLLLIQMESINNFLIGLEIEIDGQYYEITPNLNELASKYIYCDNFYTSVGIGNTSDAEFSTLTGMYPEGISYTIYKYGQNYFETLPMLFKNAGYSCYSFHGNSKEFYSRGRLHKELYGFDFHYGSEDLEVNDENLVHDWLGDKELLKQVIDVMDNSESKSFGFAITISNHTPFTEPENSVSSDKWFKDIDNLIPSNIILDEDKEINEMTRGYLEHARYTDYAIGEAIKYLKEIGMWEDTIVMLYGDHGTDVEIYNMFYDYGHLFRNNVNPLFKDGYENQILLEYQLRNQVPFIIAGDEITNKRISNAGSLPNIKATVSNMFDLNEKYTFNNDIMEESFDVCYSTKSEIIFGNGVIINTRSNTHENINGVSEDYINELIDNYKIKRQLNELILKFDLLEK